MLKKMILLICLVFVTGCTNISTSSMSLNNAVSSVLSVDNHLYNMYEVGYRYYLPRNFNLVETREYNHVFISEGVKYYLYVDLVQYYNEAQVKYEKGTETYYSEVFKYNDLDGYLEIIKKDKDFFIKMVYNYAIIEVKVQEEELIDAVIYSGIILSSIDFNKTVISNMIGEDLLGGNSKLFELVGPKEEVDDKTYLDYIEEYGNYEQEEIEIRDPDVIN